MCEKEYVAAFRDGDRRGSSQEELVAFFRRLFITAESGDRLITCVTITVPEVRTRPPGSGVGEFTPDGSQVWEIRTEPKGGPVVFTKKEPTYG